MAKSKSLKLATKVSKYSKTYNKIKYLNVKPEIKGALEEKIKIKKTKMDLQIGAKTFREHFQRQRLQTTPKRKIKIHISKVS